MMLTPIFKSADPEFNYRAAEDAARLVMSMDIDEARSFTTMVVAETLWDDIEKNRRTLQRHLNEVVTKRLDTFHRGYAQVVDDASEMISKRLTPVGMTEFGKALEEISKATANPQDYSNFWDESAHPRANSGQFRAKVRYSGRPEPVSDRVARATPSLPDPKKTKHLGKEEKAYYQQGYQQVANFLDSMMASGAGGDVTSFVTIRENRPGGRTYTKAVNGNKPPDIDPKNEMYIGVEARPTSLTIGGASFGLISALGGSPHAAARTGETMEAINTHLPTFAEEWNASGWDSPNSNARLYGRVEHGSRFLSNVAPAGSKLQMAGRFGEFVGHQGPQAEKVLGPRARTTMYRYRGTEKTPDKDLVDPYDRARTGGYSLGNLTPENRQKIETLQANAVRRYAEQKGSKPSDKEVQQIKDRTLRRAFRQSDAEATESAEVSRGKAFGVAHDFMMSKVPKDRLYDLQLKSGHTPPSEGIIMDSSGRIVTQAIGYGDDHYLPFNLKNLKGLRGGEYVRTRSVGGPTTEDIYTGLVSGAKQLTVVSRSGTFVITFDDTFRGTRRYNDKAGRMVKRYGKILDAIKSEQVERERLPDDIRAEIEAEVNQQTWITDPRVKRDQIRQKEAEYKEHPRPSKAEEEEIEAKVAYHGGDERTRQQTRATLRNRVIESKAFNFRLNGDGYGAAIKALEEQFPYYLTSNYTPTRPDRYEAAIDRGYVKPRYNRPSQALEGYYETSIAGVGNESIKYSSGKATGKWHADEVDYQNHRGRLKRIAEGADEGAAEGTTEGAAGTPAAQRAATQGVADGLDEPPTQADLAAHQLATASARKSLADAATTLQQGVANMLKPENYGRMKDILSMDETAFRKWYESPTNQEAFRRQVDLTLKPEMGKAGFTNLVTEFDAAHGLVGGEKFTRANHMNTNPTQPYSFDDKAAYLSGGNIQRKEAQLQKVASRSQVPGHLSLAELKTDDEFKAALKTAQSLRLVADQVAQQPPAERPSFIKSLVINDASVAAMAGDPKKMELLEKPERVDQMIEDVHRAWALRKLIDKQIQPITSVPIALGTGTLTPVEAPPPSPPSQAALPGTKKAAEPADNRGAAMDYSKAIGRYADQIKETDPSFAEELNEVANDLDIAAFADDDDGTAQAYQELETLLSDRPDHRETLGRVVRAQMASRYPGPPDEPAGQHPADANYERMLQQREQQRQQAERYDKGVREYQERTERKRRERGGS